MEEKAFEKKLSDFHREEWSTKKLIHQSMLKAKTLF
ncbi:hypothetical protein CCACVL1_30500 [Corchorus capsularis]|uniref:Uncharacterized protein n=1 Tax=Corchorus capsularis TaxID=210143 RepID=A0A1R3FWW1_COCAP|nr:hypothetical protein CCACVL1_30500 [Corchorus capsularis]